ncbi:hypothetical protein H4R19_002429 [Coemansia spiralis]|nr:hypothetical protein H4R19_002429 [Coemansia spiralis]
MPLCDAPDDVLACVLAMAARRPNKYHADFGQYLPLLAVCRQWRRLALPAVYSVVFYMHNSWPLDDTGNIDLQGTAAAKCPRIQTNLDLVASAGCANIVKEVYLNVNYVDAPLPGLAVAVSRLMGVAVRWSRVNQLRILACGPGRGSAKEDAVQAVASGLIAVLPGVCRFELDDYQGSAIVDGVAARLTAGYANQLRMYNGYPTPLPPGCKFERLERAVVTYRRGGEFRSQSLRTSHLRHLELNSLPLSYSWGVYVRDGSCPDIVFPELTSLKVSYDAPAVGHSPSSLPRLHFPRLCSATVRCPAAVCPLLQQAVLPVQLAKLEISAPAPLFKSLERMVIPAVQQMFVRVGITGHDPGLAVFVHSFFTRAQQAGVGDLHVSSY